LVKPLTIDDADDSSDVELDDEQLQALQDGGSVTQRKGQTLSSKKRKHIVFVDTKEDSKSKPISKQNNF
jgi:hypothetical protein